MKFLHYMKANIQTPASLLVKMHEHHRTLMKPITETNNSTWRSCNLRQNLLFSRRQHSTDTLSLVPSVPGPRSCPCLTLSQRQISVVHLSNKGSQKCHFNQLLHNNFIFFASHHNKFPVLSTLKTFSNNTTCNKFAKNFPFLIHLLFKPMSLH